MKSSQQYLLFFKIIKIDLDLFHYFDLINFFYLVFDFLYLNDY